ncbi:MAG: hypothetical protein ACM3QS_01955 [Bacteroidota bacterium]
MPNRQFNYGVLAVALLIVCGLAVALGAGAIALRAQRQPLNLVRVPGDYPTIQAAIDAAQPGDIIQVGPGTYNENLTLNKAVTLVADQFDQINPVNNPTIIDAAGGAAAITIPAGLAQMPVVRGFAIRNGGNGIQAQSAFIAEFNYFSSSGNLVNYQAGAGGSNRNNVYFGSLDDAIHIDNLNRPLLIENNRIMYAGDDGIEINLPNTSIPPAVTEVDIWNNMIIGSGEDGIQFVDSPADPQDTNRRFMIAGNLLANNKRAGIGLMPNANTVEDYSGADAVEAIRVFNDTFYGNDVGISGGDNLVSFNNIIANSVARGVRRVQGPPGANSVVAYTLFFNNGIDSEDTTLGAGIITGQDPLFAEPPNPGPDGVWGTVDDDFSGLLLRAGSPAIDKGVVQYVAASGEPVPPNPITGFTGAAPDLGWREFGSAAIVTPTATLGATITIAPSVTPPLLTPIPSGTAVPPSPTAVPPSLTPAATESPTPPTPPTVGPTSTSQPPTVTPGVTATATPQLILAAIVPNSATAGTTVNLTLTGTGFLNGAVVTFEGGQGTPSEVTALQVLNPTTIVITVNVKADASYGTQTWDVRVTNPDGSSAVLPDAFSVNPTGNE